MHSHVRGPLQSWRLLSRTCAPLLFFGGEPFLKQESFPAQPLADLPRVRLCDTTSRRPIVAELMGTAGGRLDLRRSALITGGLDPMDTARCGHQNSPTFSNRS